MIEYPMTDIRGRGILVPGGWTAYVLAVEPRKDSSGQNPAQVIYLELLMQMGKSLPDAMEACQQIVQEVYRAGYIHKLRQSILHAADKYLTAYPELAVLDEDTGLRVPIGYRPEDVQGYFLPTFGDFHESSLPDALAEMAREARHHVLQVADR